MDTSADSDGLDEFEHSKTLKFLPPEGEFALMNYRITGECIVRVNQFIFNLKYNYKYIFAADFRPPFRIYPNIEEAGPQKLEFTIGYYIYLKVYDERIHFMLFLSVLVMRAELPEGNHGVNVAVRIPMPRFAFVLSFSGTKSVIFTQIFRTTAGVTFEILPAACPGCAAEYRRVFHFITIVPIFSFFEPELFLLQCDRSQSSLDDTQIPRWLRINPPSKNRPRSTNLLCHQERGESQNIFFINFHNRFVFFCIFVANNQDRSYCCNVRDSDVQRVEPQRQVPAHLRDAQELQPVQVGPIHHAVVILRLPAVRKQKSTHGTSAPHLYFLLLNGAASY